MSSHYIKYQWPCSAMFHHIQPCSARHGLPCSETHFSPPYSTILWKTCYSIFYYVLKYMDHNVFPCSAMFRNTFSAMFRNTCSAMFLHVPQRSAMLRKTYSVMLCNVPGHMFCLFLSFSRTHVPPCSPCSAIFRHVPEHMLRHVLKHMFRFVSPCSWTHILPFSAMFRHFPQRSALFQNTCLPCSTMFHMFCLVQKTDFLPYSAMYCHVSDIKVIK